MALPTQTDTLKLDWSFRGQPFGYYVAKSDIDTRKLDWSFQGQPFVINALSSAANTKRSFGIVMG